MLVRRAVPVDAEFIGAIRVAAWQAAYREFMPEDYLGSLDPGANLDSLRASLQSEASPFVLRIAEIEGEPIAFSILGKPRYEADRSVAELWALNTHPAHWRKGAGQRLVRRALLDAKENGCSSVELWCIQGNMVAQNLYEACGFSRSGQTRINRSLTGYPLEELAYSHVL